MSSQIMVNTGSGNGLVPDGTKPLPEPMLTNHQWDPLSFIQCLPKFSNCLFQSGVLNRNLKSQHTPKEQWVNGDY